MAVGEWASHDAHYLTTTPRLYGWRGAWKVEAFSARDGAFRRGQAAGPAVTCSKMGISLLVAMLEQSDEMFPPAP